jgi:hypothetical protein
MGTNLRIDIKIDFKMNSIIALIDKVFTFFFYFDMQLIYFIFNNGCQLCCQTGYFSLGRHQDHR